MARKIDAITLLKQDHRDVEALFAEFEEAGTIRQQRRIATEICAALRLHAEAEETIFYPAAREAVEESADVDEAEVEHDTMKYLMEQIEDEELTDEMFRANVMVLKEYVEHHVEEEEEEMFKELRDTDLDLVALGEEIAALKTEKA